MKFVKPRLYGVDIYILYEPHKLAFSEYINLIYCENLGQLDMYRCNERLLTGTRRKGNIGMTKGGLICLDYLVTATPV